MRIGMMTDIYKPHVNGVINYIALNKKELELAGHEVFVFTFGDLDYEDEEPNIIRSPGLPLVDTGYYLGIRYKRSAQKLLYTMDLAHVHHPFISGTNTLRLCRPRGIPIVFTNHTRYDLYAQAYLPLLPDVVGESMLQAFLPSFCRACDLVIAPSKGMRKVMMNLNVDVPIQVTANGVDLAPFQNIENPVDRSKFGFTPDHVVLAYVGRLGPEKNLTFLLRSFAGTVRAYSHVRLLLIGDGPERDNLEDRVHTMGIANKVHFTGLVPYKQLPNYLASADAFATASVTEVHPLSIIEAMAAGLPVLGIDSPGVGDTIVDGITGLVSDKDLASFTANMVRLATEQELRQKMGEQARVEAEKYSIHRTARLMLTHYENLLNASPSRRKGWRQRLKLLYDQWRT